MFRWLIYLPFSLLFSVLCYLTNWFVAIFADKNGELPWPLHLWQMWDDSIYAHESVLNAPKFLQYDWPKHYREYKDTTPQLLKWNRERWFVECIDDNFTFVEKLKRYACGVLWLMRNNAYGFCFYLLGYTSTPFMLVEETEDTITVDEVNGDGWMYKSTAKIFSLFGWEVHWNNLLGWKLDTDATVDTRSMIANRVAFFFRKEGD